jgi:hypothetical protein
MIFPSVFDIESSLRVIYPPSPSNPIAFTPNLPCRRLLQRGLGLFCSCDWSPLASSLQPLIPPPPPRVVQFLMILTDIEDQEHLTQVEDLDSSDTRPFRAHA